MARETSAGLLMYRRREEAVQVFLAHPGGPFFARRDAGAWSIPKGLVHAAEEPLEAACREFEEEVGIPAAGPFLPLGSAKLRSGKVIHAWAFEGEAEPPDPVPSNTFEIEWPPRSGRMQHFPEIDRVAFFSLTEAAAKINERQRVFLDRLEEQLASW